LARLVDIHVKCRAPCRRTSRTCWAMAILRLDSSAPISQKVIVQRTQLSTEALGLVHKARGLTMSRPITPNLRTWPRNLSTAQGGGLSTAQGGGMATSQYGGMSTAQYGGMSTAQYGGMSTAQYGGLSTAQYGGLSTAQYGGLSTAQYGGLSTAQYGGLSTAAGGGMSTSAVDAYRSNIPPWPVFLRELEARDYRAQGNLIRRYLPDSLWPKNFFK
jgi:hypothetical protein